MRTKGLGVDGKNVEAVLMAGGPGFKIYSAGADLIVVGGKKTLVFKESDSAFMDIMQYVNLKYQPLNQHDAIKQKFNSVLVDHGIKKGPVSESAAVSEAVNEWGVPEHESVEPVKADLLDESLDHWGIPLDEAAKAKAKPKAPKAKIAAPSVNIPKGYQKFVDGSGDLSNVENWKIQVQMGNSVGRDEPDVGGWGSPGYVFINPKTKEVIPVARSDEHHGGYDLMRHLASKGVVKNLEDWGYVYIHGTHVFDKSDKTFYKQVYQTWLDLGGKNIEVEIYSSGSGGKESFIGLLSDFIEQKSFIPKKGEIAKSGQRLIQALERYATLVVQALKDPNKEAQANKAAQAVVDLVNYKLAVSKPKKAAELALASDSFQGVQDAILGMDGIKNIIHQGLREIEAGDRFMYGREYATFFGDTSAALKAFDALGAI